MRRVAVNQLRPVPQQQLFQLVDVGSRDVPANQSRARVSKTVDRTEIARPIEHDGVARIDQAPCEQIEALLRAGDHEHVIGLAAEPRRDGRAKARLPFRRPVPPDGRRVALRRWSGGVPRRRR